MDKVLTEKLGFTLELDKSSAPGSGLGAFLKGQVAPGTVVGFYPGLVYPAELLSNPVTLAHLFKEGNDYMMARYDQSVIDGNHVDEAWIEQNPYAVGHMVNHPHKRTMPNVICFEYNFMTDFPEEFQRYIPNANVELPALQQTEAASIMESMDQENVQMKGMVLVSLMHIKDEELFLNYRFNPSRARPVWYNPVDNEEDQRRWKRT